MLTNPASLTIKYGCLGICDGSQDVKTDSPILQCKYCDATKNIPGLHHDNAVATVQSLERAYDTEVERLQDLIIDAQYRLNEQMEILQKMCLHEKKRTSFCQNEKTEEICEACGLTLA